MHLLLSFKAIAFELKYSSTQIDSVYASLDLFNCGDQKIPVPVLQQYKGFLPEDFRAYIAKYNDTTDNQVDILFEQHSIPNKVMHNDWDLIAYD